MYKYLVQLIQVPSNDKSFYMIKYKDYYSDVMDLEQLLSGFSFQENIEGNVVFIDDIIYIVKVGVNQTYWLDVL